MFRAFYISLADAVSVSLAMLYMERTHDIGEASSRLRSIADRDAANMKKCRQEYISARTSDSWLFLNLFVVCFWIWPMSNSLFFKAALLTAFVSNFVCLLHKQDFSFNIGLKDLASYIQTHVAFALTMVPAISIMLVCNVMCWFIVSYACWLLFPAFLMVDVSWWDRTLLPLALVMTVVRKTFFLFEVIWNQRFYREKLVAIKGLEYEISLAQHIVDAVYGWSFSILANFAALRALYLLSALALHVGWTVSPLPMLVLAAARAPFSKTCTNIRVTLYFSTHRLFHYIRPLFNAYHREHHYSYHQTSLTACQESGMLEAPVEAIYVLLAFVFVPGGWDFTDWCVDNFLNELRHHYYDEYRGTYWKVVGEVRRLQMFVQSLLSPLASLNWGWFGVDTIRFGVINPLEGGDITNSWHGQHHWRTNKNFGYGTLDSIYDNSSTDEALRPVLQQYLDNLGKFSLRGEAFLPKATENPGKVI